MSLLDYAARTGANVKLDWAAAGWLTPPTSEGALDLIVRAVGTAESENTFGRRVGPKGDQVVPKWIGKNVLLCELAEIPAACKLGVSGPGLVSALARAMPELQLEWPWALEHPTQSEHRVEPVELYAPILVSIRWTGKRKADVGEYDTYQVTRINVDDVAGFVAAYRARMRLQGHVPAEVRADAQDPDDEDRFPF
jgi:hypothetical protein